jgi:hypothetical protein
VDTTTVSIAWARPKNESRQARHGRPPTRHSHR